MRVMLRIECTPEQDAALVEAWLNDGEAITISTRSHPDPMPVRLVYVR